MMCLGAAMSFFIGEIYYDLEAPVDGAAEFAQRFWQENHESIPSYTLPDIYKGLLKTESQEVLREYIDLVPDADC